jgi:nardilysin
LLSVSFTQHIPKERVCQIPKGKHCLKVKSFAPGNNSATSIYYQIGRKDLKNSAIGTMLKYTISEPLFDTLRTQQQLGYAVKIKKKSSKNIVGMLIEVTSQEDKFSTEFVDEKIEEFIEKKMFEILENWTDEEFDKMKDAIIKKETVPEQNLSDEVEENCKEFVNEEYMFDRKKLLAAEIRKISKQELIQYYEDFMRSGNARKLAIHVKGYSNSSDEKTEQDDPARKLKIEPLDIPDPRGGIIIKNLYEFEESLFVYPTINLKL